MGRHRKGARTTVVAVAATHVTPERTTSLLLVVAVHEHDPRQLALPLVRLAGPVRALPRDTDCDEGFGSSSVRRSA